jgi:two-component system, chemotaxis family, protein-glutamate methylesterase/glutaminase
MIQRPPHRKIEMIVIGTSLGGLRALQKILAELPEGFSTPIAAVQHRHASSESVLAQHLGRAATISVCDAEDRQPILPGRLYLAPADYHLMIEDGRFRLSTEGRVQYSRPSVDVLFESAADEYRDRLIGVILTGANEDGADGARAIKRSGGLVVVQKPSEAEAASMPNAALAAADAVLSLDEIGRYLVGCCHTDGVAK